MKCCCYLPVHTTCMHQSTLGISSPQLQMISVLVPTAEDFPAPLLVDVLHKQTNYSMRCTLAWALRNWKKDKSETRMTASILKQDPNTCKIQKNAYLLRHRHTICKLWGQSPSSSYKTGQEDNSSTKKREIISFLVTFFINFSSFHCCLTVVSEAWQRG